jgi:phosphoribosyl-AMP cyclohydrolase / phosphoribosyl-ATP pyrophosphohydrolase
MTFIHELDQLISERHQTLPEGSYTTSLFNSGLKRMAQKVGEEGVETALAGLSQDREELLNETADLFFHSLVLLHASGCSLADVESVLKKRHEKK